MPARVFIRPHHISAKRIRYFNAHSHLHKHTTHTINENHRSGSFLISLYLLKKLAQPFHAIVQIMLNSSNRTIQPLKTLTLSSPPQNKTFATARLIHSLPSYNTRARLTSQREKKRLAALSVQILQTRKIRTLAPLCPHTRASAHHPPILSIRQPYTREKKRLAACARAYICMYIYIKGRPRDDEFYFMVAPARGFASPALRRGWNMFRIISSASSSFFCCTAITAADATILLPYAFISHVLSRSLSGAAILNKFKRREGELSRARSLRFPI